MHSATILLTFLSFALLSHISIGLRVVKKSNLSSLLQRSGEKQNFGICKAYQRPQKPSPNSQAKKPMDKQFEEVSQKRKLDQHFSLLPLDDGVNLLLSMCLVSIILCILGEMDWRKGVTVGLAPVLVFVCSHFAFLPIPMLFELEEVCNRMRHFGYAMAIWTHVMGRVWVGVVILRKIFGLVWC